MACLTHTCACGYTAINNTPMTTCPDCGGSINTQFDEDLEMKQYQSLMVRRRREAEALEKEYHDSINKPKEGEPSQEKKNADKRKTEKKEI